MTEPATIRLNPNLHVLFFWLFFVKAALIYMKDMWRSLGAISRGESSACFRHLPTPASDFAE